VLGLFAVVDFLVVVHQSSGTRVVFIVVVVVVLVHQWSHPVVLVDCVVVHHGEVFVVESVADSTTERFQTVKKDS
jgi:hypothetical protein